MPKATPAFLLACSLALASLAASSQSTSTNLPSFEAATIKPPDPTASSRLIGFYGDPGGRIFFGGPVRLLIEVAFNLGHYQLEEGPTWINSQWIDVHAVPPENSPSRNITVRNANPTPEQRLMLQSLLADRFGFKFHTATKEGEVYILTRGTKPLQLKSPKDPAADPRSIVIMKQGGFIDGEAVGTNTTTDYMAHELSRFLQLPVLNQTGITGSYDYYLPTDDPNNQDMTIGALNVVDRLGLKLKRGRGPIQSLVIDHIDQPSEN